MRAWIPAILVVAACNGDNIDGNREPSVAPFTLSTLEDLPVTRTITPVDLDLGDVLTVAVPIPPSHGAVDVSGLAITYSPAPDYHGPDRFAIVVSDGVADASATIFVTVESVDDRPIGGTDTLATNEDTPRVVPFSALLANDTDADGDTLTLSSVGFAVNGVVSVDNGNVTFRPNPNFSGAASFIYTVTDGVFTEPVLVNVVVGGANDAPIANNDNVSTAEDTPITISGSTLLSNDVDPDGQVLNITAVTNLTNGTVVLNGGNPIFTPTTDFTGTATFQYTVTDGVANATAVVTVNVGGANDPPVATDDSGFTTDEDTPITFNAATDLLANDVDVDAGQTLTITAVSGATNGTVALNGGNPIFTPTTNSASNATGTFTYTVSDGAGGSDTGVVTITITPINDNPIAVADSATTDEDTAITFTGATALTANDIDNDSATLSVTATNNAVNGTVVINSPTSVTFTPNTNATSNVTGSFEYTVSDGDGGSATGTVTITITPVNDPPVAVNDPNLSQNGAATAYPHATLLANDSDGGDGGALTITAVANATNGTVSLQGAPINTITFTPNEDFAGTATFTYTISDGGATTSTATATVDVTSARHCGDGNVQAPEACDDGGNGSGDGCSPTCTVEPGFACSGSPSVCTTVCGDGVLTTATEECDDGPNNTDNTDGCTTKCKIGRTCTVTDFPGGATFVVDPDTGHCYVDFVGPQFHDAAQAFCVARGGYLATITNAGENGIATQAVAAPGGPLAWIGAFEIATAPGFDWVTDEPFAFNNFVPPEPDGAGNGFADCVTLESTGQWFDLGCNNNVISTLCEFEPDPCGDSVLHVGEECDDGNAIDGDGCSATCKLEELVRFSFTGALGNEATFPADGGHPGLLGIPSMSRGAGVTASLNGDTFSATNWTSAVTLDPTDFFSFTVTLDPAFTSMTLQILELDERRSGTGIRSWSVRSSLDAFAADLQVFAVPDDILTRTDQRIVLPASFANVTGPVEFRIFGFAAEAGGGSWRIDNVQLFGFTTP